MAAVSDIVNIAITVQAAQLTRPGFGTPLILAPLHELPAGFAAQTTRTYSTQAALVADFAAGTSVNGLAAAIFAQQPHPPLVKVGALSSNPTQSWTITPTAINSTVYSGTWNGLPWSYTSDSSATLTEVCTGIAAAINALSGVTVTAANVSNTHVTVIANTAGQFNSFSIDLAPTLPQKLIQDHADISSGLATDLAAILVNDQAWYAILYGFNSAACVTAIAGWAESNGKLFVAQTQDSDVINVAKGSDTTSVWYTNRAKTRTALIYKVVTNDFADAAWAGICLPLTPGSETWAYKTLAGVNPDALTETQRTNALTKNVNAYETIAGVNVTEQGKVLSGSAGYIDVVRFIDWLQVNMAIDVFGAQVNSLKVPYTDPGIAVIAGLILARLELGVQAGGLVAGKNTVNVPTAASVSSGDRASRTLNNVTFNAQLAGAIQLVNVAGTVSA